MTKNKTAPAGRDDRQAQALRRRLDKEREEHARTIAAKNAQLAALRDSWQLFDTFPNLESFLMWLHRIRDAASPLRATSYEVRGSGVSDPTGSAGSSRSSDRSRVDVVNGELAVWTSKLADLLSPKGRLVDDELSVVRPRCFNPECPARLLPQAFDLEICVDCKRPFIDFRDPDTRCWRRNCGRSRGHTGECDA